MINCLRRNLSIILVSILALILIAINIMPESIVMGLDNASPYFEPLQILSHIKGASSLVFGGIVFQIPYLYLLKALGATPALISNIYLFTNFFTGILGIALLVRNITRNSVVTVLGSLLFISSLLIPFIFSQPNFLFIAAFGSIPILVYLLILKKRKWYHYIFLILFSISFLTTTLNLVAFLLYLAQIVVLSSILSKDKKAWITSSVWGLLVLLLWGIVMQTLTLVNGDTNFFLLNIYTYIQNLLSNPYMPVVTEGILESEKTNTLLRTIQYALGWMELHDSNNVPVFEYYGLYRENILYTLIGIIPFLFAIPAILFKKTKKTFLLFLLLIAFLVLCSSFGMEIISRIPYLSSTLRWASSKLWPIYIMPLTILFSITIKHLTQKSLPLKAIIVILFTIPMIFYAYPTLTGNLLSTRTLVTIPEEYFELPRDSRILVLPHPQKLYMRQYDWGYYGSDFLTYVSNSEIIDGANLYEYSVLYEDIFRNQTIPDDIDYVLYDHTAEGNLDKNLLDESRSLVLDLKKITSKESYTLYENK